MAHHNISAAPTPLIALLLLRCHHIHNKVGGKSMDFSVSFSDLLEAEGSDKKKTIRMT